MHTAETPSTLKRSGWLKAGEYSGEDCVVCYQCYRVRFLPDVDESWGWSTGALDKEQSFG